ncbi:unnamed protein product [Blepharisma stoltei]|uniref:F-box protein n=1 Tax=Blepharisma stoltei TaxID=1481888 RepID=A0AAU9ISU4_9CILI|nr:unnamed protein product [Blepharisma stoltei]
MDFGNNTLSIKLYQKNLEPQCCCSKTLFTIRKLWNGSLELMELDTETSQLKYTPTNFKIDPLRLYDSLPILNSKLLIYENSYRQGSSSACIFNLQSYAIENKINWIEGFTQKPAFYEGWLYFFGSKFSFVNNCYLPFYKKLDLNLMKWSVLLENPAQHSQFDSIQFNNSILILEKKDTCIWQFDMFIESYSLLFKTTVIRSVFGNTLATGNMRVYVFEGQGSIYESDIGNQYTLKIIGVCKIDIFDYVYKTNDDQNIFLASVINIEKDVWLYSYFRFNLENKSITKVREVELDEF